MLHEKNILASTNDALSTYKLGKESSLNKLKDEQVTIETALTKLESKHLLGEFASDTIYINTKKTILTKLDRCRLAQEVLVAELERLSSQEQWLSWLDRVAELVGDAGYEKGAKVAEEATDAGNTGEACPNGSEVSGSATDLNEYQKMSKSKLKALLSNVLDSIYVDYDRTTLLHTLDIKLRLPITKNPSSLFDNLGSNKSLKSSSRYQPRYLDSGVETYSTVTTLPESAGYVDLLNDIHLKFNVHYETSRLTTPPFGEYQKFLFDTIDKFYREGKTFKDSSDWLIANGFQTPRGNKFTHKHTWSIYMKRSKVLERLAEVYEPVISDVDIHLRSD